MKNIILAFLIIAAAGCSKASWVAKYYMVRAENAFNKSHALRINPNVPSNKRLGYYRSACRDFRKAHEVDPRVFTLFRIELAFDACLRVEDREGAALFRNFQEEYNQAHPTEEEYGDAGAWIGMEG